MTWAQSHLFLKATFGKMTDHVGPTLATVHSSVIDQEKYYGEQGREIEKNTYIICILIICWKYHDTMDDSIQLTGWQR